MKKKTLGSSPAIDISRLANDIINPSLEGHYISLFDHNDFDEARDVIYDEGIEEYLTIAVDSFEYTQKATTKTIDIAKQFLKLYEKYEIVAFNIGEDEYDRIIIFLKNAKDHFTMLILLYSYEINVHFFMNNIVNLEEFRCYGNNNYGLHGFYMKDDLIGYDFELLKFDKLFTTDRILLYTVEPISSKRQDGLYFVIKNTLGDSVIMTHLPGSDDIEIFNKALTKADPQAGLLFSLSYNTNK